MGLIQHYGSFRPIYSYPQQVSAFISRGATHHAEARDLYQRRRELLPMNFTSKSVIYGRTRIFYMPQSWDMGQILLLPLRRKVYRGFSGHPKNSTASAGFEPANSGSSGQYANHQTTEAVSTWGQFRLPSCEVQILNTLSEFIRQINRLLCNSVCSAQGSGKFTSAINQDQI